MYWCAAQLQPSRTVVALHFLEQAGFEVYHPRLRERRLSHGRRIETTPSLFPGYAFVWIELQWHAARWAPGVVRLIMDGVAPAVVPAAVIDGLKAREINGAIELPKPPKFRPGRSDQDLAWSVHRPHRPACRHATTSAGRGAAGAAGRAAGHVGGRGGRARRLEGPAFGRRRPLAGYFWTGQPYCFPDASRRPGEAVLFRKMPITSAYIGGIAAGNR